MSLIAVIGDVHHYIGLAIEGLVHIEQELGQPISQGDFLTGPKKYRAPEESPAIRRWDASYFYFKLEYTNAGGLTHSIPRLAVAGLSEIYHPQQMQPQIVVDSLDQLLSEGKEFSVGGGCPPQVLQAKLKEIFLLLEAVRSDYPKLPVHLHPLQCLLFGEFGNSGLESMKKCPLQRYAKRIRNFLIRHFRMPTDSP